MICKYRLPNLFLLKVLAFFEIVKTVESFLILTSNFIEMLGTFYPECFVLMWRFRTFFILKDLTQIRQ